MKIRWVLALLFVSLTFAGPLYAGSVYSWTDEDGVRHYSNTGIPDEVVEADVQPEENAPSQAVEASEETDVNADEGAPPEGPSEGGDTAETAPTAQGTARFEAKVEKERQRLEAQIKMIKGLSIGKSFTPGMKDARIRPIEEQLALLNADAKRYFRMKRQGAFTSTYPDGSAENAPTPTNPLSDGLSSEAATSSAGGSSGNDDTSQEETTE
jgi:hypothetical protein